MLYNVEGKLGHFWICRYFVFNIQIIIYILIIAFREGFKKKKVGNIQFEGLCTLFFLGQIVANRVKKQREFDPWILEKNYK